MITTSTSTIEDWSPKDYEEYLEKQKKSEPIKERVKKENTNTADLKLVPGLYSGVKWIAPKRYYKEDFEGLSAVYISDQDSLHSIGQPVYTYGNIWTYKNKDLDVDEVHKISEDFRKFYSKVFIDNGLQGFFYNDYVLTPLSGDSPAGGSYGEFFRDKNNNLRIVNTSIWIDYKNMHPEEGEEPCPCSITLKVFLSDPLDPQDLISRALTN